MWLPFQVFHPNKMSDAEQMRTIREGLARSMELLRRAPVADTFLGRKTQEPFPREDEAIRIDRWLSSRELQPPKK
ncbi:hypothetical protein [Bradyrhizobium cajani]|uniref:Uncharacterized protein n=1 Tax=Bradyrhizobium cajani TaxID=1928661 RepID=A0A844TL91_9BRAD|nr:hypothetical protein [Bradyrhizobium cajani]MCP3369065.1 hypothetical protein [Bradyrhizobium cajani]MVT77559.1 hypothetical protein [Bradyrhizobium cajani]